MRLSEWLGEWLPASPSAEFLASLDLKDFIRSSAHIAELNAGERLRLLAVHLDDEVIAIACGRPISETWQWFSRIYEEALRLDPDNVWTLHSKSVTAIELRRCVDDDDPAIPSLMRASLEASAAALELDGSDARLRYNRGYVLYFSGDGQTNDALEEFRRAASTGPRRLQSDV